MAYKIKGEAFLVFAFWETASWDQTGRDVTLHRVLLHADYESPSHNRVTLILLSEPKQSFVDFVLLLAT